MFGQEIIGLYRQLETTPLKWFSLTAAYFVISVSQIKSLIKDGVLFSLSRDVNEDGWATNVVSEAITKLLEIEKRIMPPNNNSIGIREEKLLENQSDYGSDSLQDDARSYLKIFMDSGDDESSKSEVSVKQKNDIEYRI